MNQKTVEIFSRADMEKRALRPFVPNTTLISIGDPDAPSPRFLFKPSRALRLVFDDLTPELAVDYLELPKALLHDPLRLEEEAKAFGTVLFSDKLAMRAAAFILQFAEETDIFICQCEFGQSRSAAFAAAIAEYCNGDGARIFSDRRYAPNPFVYEKVLAALYAKKKEMS